VSGEPDLERGFSDPDLTQDAGGRVYNTGIDLVNDSLFSFRRRRADLGQGNGRLS